MGLRPAAVATRSSAGVGARGSTSAAVLAGRGTRSFQNIRASAGAPETVARTCLLRTRGVVPTRRGQKSRQAPGLHLAVPQGPSEGPCVRPEAL